MAKGKSSTPPGHVNLRMLAEHLELSQTTVSLVLNNSPSAKSIPAETRLRVTEAAERLNYRPNYFARSLRQSKSMSVGVLAPDLSEGYFTRVMSGVVQELTAAHYFYFTACHDWKRELIEQYPRMLVERAVDGFLLLNTPADHIEVPVPVVAISAHSAVENVTNIVLDHHLAAEQALVRLARLLPTPEEQRDVYARLGELYSRHLVNLSRAEGALKEVLKRAPDDAATSEKLVDVYRRQNDPARALELQQELIGKSRGPEEKRHRLVELATIHEQTAHDNRKAEQTLEAARREFPQDVGILRALADFYTRHHQAPAVNILLDRAGADARRAMTAGTRGSRSVKPACCARRVRSSDGARSRSPPKKTRRSRSRSCCADRCATASPACSSPTRTRASRCSPSTPTIN